MLCQGSEKSTRLTVVPPLLADLVIQLRTQAYVNELVTSWYDPCRNLPPVYTIYYERPSTGTWVAVIDRKFNESSACISAPSKLESCFCRTVAVIMLGSVIVVVVDSVVILPAFSGHLLILWVQVTTVLLLCVLTISGLKLPKDSEFPLTTARPTCLFR